MGSISDALRRAQQEREVLRRRRIEEAAAKATQPLPAAEVATAEPAAAPEAPPVPAPAAEDSPPNDLPIINLEELGPSFVAWHDRAAAASEQYRSLRTRLMNLNESKESVVLAITSSATGEGKTTTTMNMALTFAELRHLKILVADGDLRRCTLTNELNCPEGAGMAEVLRGEAKLPEVIRRTMLKNLSFLPAGSLGRRNAAELLGSHACEGLMNDLRRWYDYVLVDLPPANAVADASIVGVHCNGAVLVVRMHRTPEPNVKHALRLLESSNVRVLGCVLIGQRHWKASWLHEYGYGYDYDGGYSGYREY
jgi:succinoglycan biosynthesis transport protein ExoP